jgi:rhodanese-related sulfurtransferase
MFDSIRNLFGIAKIDYTQLIAEGSIILDVRSGGEFAGGHIEGSVNIPVNRLAENLNKLKPKNKSIITCCASGIRSATAKSILESNGYLNVHNGGSWLSLNQKIK